MSAVLCAFDLIELDGEDLRRAPLEHRKRALSKLLSQKHDGIVLNASSPRLGRVIANSVLASSVSGCRPKRASWLDARRAPLPAPLGRRRP